MTILIKDKTTKPTTQEAYMNVNDSVRIPITAWRNADWIVCFTAFGLSTYLTLHYNNQTNVMDKLARLFLVSFTVSVLAACAPQTEDEQIASVNRRIRPEGHLTKTHLYIHWPAVYTQPQQYTQLKEPSVEEVVPALTLKIPFEYLGQSTLPIPFVSKEELEASRRNYSWRINSALRISKNQITSVFLGMQHPGAKPYVPMTPYKEDPPDVADRNFANFIRFYAVHIKRDYWHAIPLDQRIPGQNPYHRPPESSCRPDLPNTDCHVDFGIKGRLARISGVGESLENYWKHKAKAAKQNQQAAELASKLPPDGLPRWHEKVDPTQALINRFILPEDSPEVRTLFHIK
jgi:hypothetical protein